VPKLTTPAELTSYFGVRVLLLEGGAVADITALAKRPQLLFLLGTFFGALKAKHDRWAVVEFLIENAGLRKILAPFVGPWLRATVYTGDRIAYACSRDLGTSLDAVFRTLVGKELSPQLQTAGLIKQAQRVRNSLILRFSQLFRSVPHATNRFLHLLRFAQQVQPDSVAAFIPEHHGTTEITYFLDKAKKVDGGQARKPDDFMYPGPRPRSMETAIAMIADSVEAALRVLEDLTPQKIEEAIDHIVRTKVSAGQLDEAPLTLQQIEQVKQAFLVVLSGMYHNRIDYPESSGGIGATWQPAATH